MSYIIETCKNEKRNTYEISVLSDDRASALSVIAHKISECKKSGTKLIVKAIKKHPNIDNLKNMLSYRFLFDPEFQIYVNDELVDYKEYINATHNEVISIDDNAIDVSVYGVPEGEKNTALTGIAFWVGKRLVGNPSWTIDNQRVEDARRKFALKHIIIVKADFLHGDVSYDWSGFQKTEKVKKVNDAVIEHIKKFRTNYYQERINDVKIDVIKQNLDEIGELSIPSRYELREFFDIYLEEKPEVDAEELNVIVKALINILNSRNGLSLLNRLSVLDTDQVAALDDILSEWSIFDIKTVLDEIDGRLKVINAIEKLCDDKTINELQTLHPLVSQAKWLFGVEYDTPNYTSNNTISTVMKKFFNDKKKLDVDIKWMKRPDLVIGRDFTVGISSSDEFDENEIVKIGKILIIELKRGGFVIDRNEMNQAEEYADFIYNGNALNAKPTIKVFVVGDSVSPIIGSKKSTSDGTGNVYCEIQAYTYTQLVRTAERRLLNLRGKLSQRYSKMNVNDYLQKILNEPKQLKLPI